uniref:Uncharacterized protein n=1 Tax=Nannospalax galili TaxID=1026970 RepID=A0A8C6QZ66_NANGA
MSLGKMEIELDTRKARLYKGLRWKTQTQETPGALYSDSRNNLCPSTEHASKVCLCGCSLRTKAMLHPRPNPASLQTSWVFPSLPPGKKAPDHTVMVLRDQLSHSPSKSKAEANSQVPAVPLHMGVWPKGFIQPLP